MKEVLRRSDPARRVYSDESIEVRFGGKDVTYSFDDENLNQIAEDYKGNFKVGSPWPHLHFTNFLHYQLANEVHLDIPTPEEYDFYRYSNELEQKYAFDRVKRLPEFLHRLFLDLSTPFFLKFLEKLTGIKGLIPDPYYRGGGVHLYPSGGKLDVHLNNNIHPTLGLYRRVDLVLFLNKDWEKSWGGEFEFWEGEKTEDRHVLTELRQKVLPEFNTLIIMENSERSYHGVPRRVECPKHEYRKSLACSYYTVAPPDDLIEERKYPLFVKRPTDEPSVELDSLRQERAKGRLHTNVKREDLAQ